MSNNRVVAVLDRLIQNLYKVAYRLQIVANFFRRESVRGAYVAVWHQHKILLILNSYKSYKTLPCGGVKRSEGAHQAAARELAEEVGIVVKEEQLSLAQVVICNDEFKEDTIYIYELLLTETPDVQIDNREVVWASFLTKEEALKEKLSPPVRAYIVGREASL